jgi:hypothetical protein
MVNPSRLGTDLDRIKVKVASRAARTTKKQWRTPRFEDLAPDCHIMAVDQSLRATGVVLLSTVLNRLTIVRADILATTPSERAQGHEDTLQAAVQLQMLFERYLVHLEGPLPPYRIVHEAPPLSGRGMHRPESSLLAAAALRAAARFRVPQQQTFTGRYVPVEILPMVRRQDHAWFICGESNALKKDHHAVLMDTLRFMPVVNLDLITNEAKRDALSVGLFALHRLAKETP